LLLDYKALEQEYLDSDFRGLVVMQRSFCLFLIKWRNNQNRPTHRTTDDNEELMNFFDQWPSQFPNHPLSIKQQVVQHWGPQPNGAVELIQIKKEHGVIDETIKADLQLWYLHDKGLSTQSINRYDVRSRSNSTRIV
jgi:hypothetical protein